MKSEDSIAFFDWESQLVIRRIEVAPKAVYWNEDGTRVALALEEGTYILRCNKEVYLSATLSLINRPLPRTSPTPVFTTKRASNQPSKSKPNSAKP